MLFRCRISTLPDGRWSIIHAGADPDIGPLHVTASSRELAVSKMRGELRCRLNLNSPGDDSRCQAIEIELDEQ